MSGTPMKYRDNPGARIWPRLVKNGECMEWAGSRNEHGYGGMRVDGVAIKAHRYAYELANGPIPDGMDVLHSCDNPPCCNPEHLSLGDAKKNAQEMVGRGRHAVSRYGTGYLSRGESHGRRKLSNESVTYIRANPEHLNISQLSRKFGVARATIRSVIENKTWSHL